MNKKALEKEAKTKCFMLTVNTIGIDQRDVELAYVMGAEPREKRIAELEAQIEKMKLCQNCKSESKDYTEEPCRNCTRCLGDIKREGNTDNWEFAE